MLLDDILWMNDLDLHQDNYGVVLRSMDPKTHPNEHIDAEDLMSKNSDLEDKLLWIQKEAKQIGRVEKLNKD